MEIARSVYHAEAVGGVEERWLFGGSYLNSKLDEGRDEAFWGSRWEGDKPSH